MCVWNAEVDVAAAMTAIKAACPSLMMMFWLCWRFSSLIYDVVVATSCCIGWVDRESLNGFDYFAEIMRQ